MASWSSACRTPTTVAHDAPQLPAPVSDRAPQVEMAMDYIQQYHVTSTCPKAYGGKLVDSLTECKACEQSLGSAPVSDSATWRIRHNKHASARTTPRTDELLNFTELPSPRCGRQCQWSQRTSYCTAPCRRAKHHWGAHDCLWHETRPKRPPPTRPVLRSSGIWLIPDAMPQDDHVGQDTAPCTTSAPGFASAAEPSLYSMD